MENNLDKAIQRARFLICYTSKKEAMEKLAVDFGNEIAYLAIVAAIILDDENSLTPKFDLN
jgi:hypothetical protein